MKYKLIGILFICLNLIFCASAQKKFERAQQNDPQYQYNMAIFYLNAGNVDEAIRHLKATLALNNRYDLAYNALGLAYSMKGNFESAVEQYQNCLRINPAFTEAHNNMGTAYQEMGLIDNAMQEFRIAISDQNYRTKELPYYNMARLYLIQDKVEDALWYVEKSIEFNKKFTMGYNFKGVILEKLGKYEEAIECYESALTNIAKEKDVDINFNLAVAYFKNNEFKKAKEIFEKIYIRATDPEMKKEIDRYLRMIK